MQVGLGFGTLLGRFLVDFGTNLGSKLEPSWDQNRENWAPKSPPVNPSASQTAAHIRIFFRPLEISQKGSVFIRFWVWRKNLEKTWKNIQFFIQFSVCEVLKKFTVSYDSHRFPIPNLYKSNKPSTQNPSWLRLEPRISTEIQPEFNSESATKHTCMLKELYLL